MPFDGDEHSFLLRDGAHLAQAIDNVVERALGVVFWMGIPVAIGVAAIRPHTYAWRVDRRANTRQRNHARHALATQAIVVVAQRLVPAVELGDAEVGILECLVHTL